MMTEAEIEKQAEAECKKLLQSEKGYDGISFQEFWAEGAKWGAEHSIEWHDLRKNPNDLPKECKEYRVCYKDKDKNGLSTLWYYPKHKSFWTLKEVIAWCELPQFKE